MQKYHHIKAIFLLGIFCLLVLHTVVPHSHHQHEADHTHLTAELVDTHSHHHDVPENENAEKSLLDLFFAAHVHSPEVVEIGVLQEHNVQKTQVKKDINTPFCVSQYSILSADNLPEKDNVFRPSNTYPALHLTALDSRGPPHLG